MRWGVLVTAVAVMGLSGCGDGDGNANIDPRCVRVCTHEASDIEGAYDVCSAGSVTQCQRECQARIADTETVCATCLLEGTCFGGEDDPTCRYMGVGGCSSAGCTLSGREGSCTYPLGDTAAYENCVRQVYPRRTVECTSEYRPVSDCASLCVQPQG
jgi:hypothetical protein